MGRILVDGVPQIVPSAQEREIASFQGNDFIIHQIAKKSLEFSGYQQGKPDFFVVDPADFVAKKFGYLSQTGV
jgi:hypothetical protein